ncbi:hypothetical protein AAH450_09250 [Erwinia sp. P7711]|jgi:hypothetical protein|uniref:Uncharacterized protein n=1 Tax=Erwinia pyri TaxID=3062598 RepID=A0AA50DGQ2_9GAMM|nr:MULTISPECIES: hypothetical protein [unclassified Erwinia]MDW8846074.1 hypothetical protein [Erwinia sp. MMLR14_017]WLS77854.1 hypothetical protein Q3V30_15455 [Erwinia sp. DE2]
MSSISSNVAQGISSVSSAKNQIETATNGADYASQMTDIMKKSQEDNLQKAETDRILAKSNGQANSATTAASAANQNKIQY